MKLKALIIGMAMGAVAAAILVETCPQVKKFLDNSKRQLKSMISEE